MLVNTGKIKIDFPDVEGMIFGKGYKAVCGVDEAGRGPLAGPVVAAAVILPENFDLDGLDDSKKCSPELREEIFQAVIELGVPCGIGIIDNKVIDQINILKASLMAMRKAVMDLGQQPDFVLVDGNQMIPKLSYPQMSVIGGDSRCKAISAASIMAKVTRDRIMMKYDELYPAFSFAQHKGYGTEQHLAELKQHGPCDIHRRSFRPVAELLEKQYAFF